jgi:hypothetical protein
MIGLGCDRKKKPRAKGKFYRMLIRSLMLYETKYWVVKSQEKSELGVI